MKIRISALMPIMLVCLLLRAKKVAADPVLDIVVGSQSRHLGRDELLSRPDVAQIAVPNDVAYGKPMTYLAVPVASLLAGLSPGSNSVIESVALDGFAAQLPLDLLTNEDPAKAVAWVAIEPGDPRWPTLPGKAESAGPFYIVWTGASAAEIRSEHGLINCRDWQAKCRRWNAGPRSMSTQCFLQKILLAPVLLCS